MRLKLRLREQGYVAAHRVIRRGAVYTVHRRTPAVYTEKSEVFHMVTGSGVRGVRFWRSLAQCARGYIYIYLRAHMSDTPYTAYTAYTQKRLTSKNKGLFFQIGVRPPVEAYTGTAQAYTGIKNRGFRHG